MKNFKLILLIAISICFGSYTYAQEPVHKMTKFANEQEMPKFLKSCDPGYVKYIYQFRNFPKEETLVAKIIRPLFEEEKPFLIFKIDKNEEWVNTMDESIYPFLVISERGFLPGEKIILAINSKKSSFEKHIQLIPNPISYVNNAGFGLEAELLAIQPSLYEIHLLEVKEGENLKFTSVSCHEKIEKVFRYLVNSQITFSFDVIGKKTGNATLTVEKELDSLRALTPAQKNLSVSVSFPWGKELLEYREGSKKYSPLPKTKKNKS